MPRFPSLSGPAQALPPSVLEGLMRRLAAFPGPAIRLHIGETHLSPPEASRLGALGFTTGADADLYRYSPAPGKQRLLDALVDKVRSHNGLAGCSAENLQITSGATHALSCGIRSLLEPGDHLLVLTPSWSLLRGIALSAGVLPVEVPFSHVLLRCPSVSPEDLIEPFVTPRTAGIYLCTPNNPDGKVLDPDALRSIARVAQRHDLWVLADEVYEQQTYDGRAHTSIASLPGMAERTATVFSFSKSYGQAGLRVGYLVGPAPAVTAVRRMSNHTVYCVPRAMQRAALRALESGADFLAQARDQYREQRDLAHARLGELCLVPEGSTYLFLDLERHRRRGEADAMPLLERIADAGVLLAPGIAFGHAYGSWARLCFTAVDRALLEEGLSRISRVLSS